MCESVKIATSETRISNKPHKCCECGGVIFYKERYFYFSGIWDKKWETYKTCQDCAELRNKYVDQYGLHYDEIPPFEHLAECIFEHDLFYAEKMVDIMDRRGGSVPSHIRRTLNNVR